MIAASTSQCSLTLPRRSSMSTEPPAVDLTTTTLKPAITADAALVPWALDGMRQTLRSS